MTHSYFPSSGVSSLLCGVALKVNAWTSRTAVRQRERREAGGGKRIREGGDRIVRKRKRPPPHPAGRRPRCGPGRKDEAVIGPVIRSTMMIKGHCFFSSENVKLRVFQATVC